VEPLVPTLARRTVLAGAAAALVAPRARAAVTVPFATGWREQRFPRRIPNRFRFAPDGIDILSDGGVSLALHPLPETAWGMRRAAWSWSVAEGVPPTDLSRRGGDDRNLALYALFLPEDDARRLSGAGTLRVMGARSARVIVYTWGGPPGGPRLFANPWLDGRGVTVVLRPAGTGRFAETADLAADARRAFGAVPGALFGLALSADSDDTGGRIRARIEALHLTA
jgi:hypothetical protein